MSPRLKIVSLLLISSLLLTIASGCKDSSGSADSGSGENGKEVTKDSVQLAMEVRIDSLNSKMMDIFRSTGKPDIKTAMYAVEAYEDYAHYYESDPKSGYYLMKAGEIYENVLNDKERANRRYQSAYLHPSDFENKPMALFRSANIYTELNDTAKAIYTFNLFIEKYPDHDFADDAVNMIKITRMGMDAFLEQAQQNSAETKEVQ